MLSLFLRKYDSFVVEIRKKIKVGDYKIVPTLTDWGGGLLFSQRDNINSSSSFLPFSLFLSH